MRVLVCGGREYTDAAMVFAFLSAIHMDEPITLLIQGGAVGADRLAKEWADSRGIPCHTENAKWDVYKKAAGPIRNAEMLKLEPDLVIAFPGGRGTENMIQQALKAGVEVLRVV